MCVICLRCLPLPVLGLSIKWHLKCWSLLFSSLLGSDAMLGEWFWHSEGLYWLHILGSSSFFWTVRPMKMKAQPSFNTVEATHHMTQHHIPEDLNFPQRDCKDFRFHITESCFQNQQIKEQWKISAANQISGWIRARWGIGTPDSWHSRDSKSCTGRPQPWGLQYFEQFVCRVSQQLAWHRLSVTEAWETWHFGSAV